jgi:hypothetical protein
VLLGLPEDQVPRVTLARTAEMELTASLVLLVPPEIGASLVKMASLESREYLVRRDLQAYLDPRDCPDTRDLLANKATLVCPVLKVREARLAQQVLLALLASKDLEVSRDHLEKEESPVSLDNLDQQVQLAKLDPRDPSASQATLDLKDYQVYRASLDLQDPRVLQALLVRS